MENYFERKKPLLYGVLLGLVVYVFQVLLFSGMAIEVMVILSLLVTIGVVVLRSAEPISTQRAGYRR